MGCGEPLRGALPAKIGEVGDTADGMEEASAFERVRRRVRGGLCSGEAGNAGNAHLLWEFVGRGSLGRVLAASSRGGDVLSFWELCEGEVGQAGSTRCLRAPVRRGSAGWASSARSRSGGVPSL